MELLTLAKILVPTSQVLLDWITVVQGMIRLLNFVQYMRMIQKPFKRDANYYQFFDYLIDVLLIGLFMFFDVVLQRLCQDIREIHGQTKELAQLHKKFEKNNNRRLEGKENQLLLLKTKLDQVESQLETKAEEVNVAKADVGVLRNLFGESLIEQSLLVEECRSLQKQLQLSDMKLKELEYELEKKTKDIDAAEGDNIVLRNLFGELLVEQGILVEENQSLQNQLKSSDPKLNELQKELEPKTKDADATEADIIVLRNLIGELLIEQGFVVEENKSLKNRLKVSHTKIEQLESEFETKEKDVQVAEAMAIALKKQSDILFLEYDHLHEENKILRWQLESEILTEPETS